MIDDIFTRKSGALMKKELCDLCEKIQEKHRDKDVCIVFGFAKLGIELYKGLVKKTSGRKLSFVIILCP